MVESISKAPPIDSGDGEVVTARFVTDLATNLVSVKFEDGTELSGTDNHPVWDASEGNWKPLGEFKAGDNVTGRQAEIRIESTRVMEKAESVYNIEVANQHAYEVTLLAILVHNNDIDCYKWLELQHDAQAAIKAGKEVPADIARQIEEIQKQLQKFEDFVNKADPRFIKILKEKEAGEHLHHILLKVGYQGRSAELVLEGMEVLVLRYGINPWTDPNNLVYSFFKGVHKTPFLEKVVDVLKRADAEEWPTANVIAELNELGEKAKTLAKSLEP